jgi:hypothetical protein
VNGTDPRWRPGPTGPAAHRSGGGPAPATAAEIPAAGHSPRPAGGVPMPTTAGGRFLALPVVAYRRWLSPALPARCRFYPSCSAYALEALARHGALRGTGLAVRRLLRCHPFHPGGYDPVPGTDATGAAQC